ncbi:MAG: UDP-N-acetylmuramate dehydrogenase [Deltaproteobacteria bacterium]|nr:UDP-N-acetylmuramate dehydrogenase [Deltaproteobacteria bacterium]
MALNFREQVPLAPLTTLELGGPARYFVSVASEDEVQEALAWAADGGHRVLLLGGGSNIVIGDAGFDGLVMHLGALRGVSFQEDDEDEDCVEVTAAAGEPWDALVSETVGRDLAGLECLSGIPGFVGGAPIQNIGAYGQEVSETIVRVRTFDRKSAGIGDITPADCGFSYRESSFKREPDRHVVLSVTFRLEVSGAPAVRYGELQRALAAEVGGAAPSLRRVRDQVIALRRAKSMVLDPQDDNRRSAGSFFTNPVVPDAEADRVVSLAVAEGLVQDPGDVPRYPAGKGFTKLAAGWLIERAGIAKGTRRGNVGISTRHALGLVHHGGARTQDLLDLAREVRTTVEDRFGVTLVSEPRLVNCAL